MNLCNNVCKYNCLRSDQDFRVMSVLNYGAFVIEIEGFYYIGIHIFDFGQSYLAVLQEWTARIPLNATNIILIVTVFDIFRGSYEIFHMTFPTADDRCYLTWGLSFAAQIKKIPCTSPRLLKTILPPAAIIPYSCLNDYCPSPSSDLQSNNSCSNKFLCYKNNCNCTPNTNLYLCNNYVTKNKCNIKKADVCCKDIYS